MTEETITITKKEHEQLLFASRKLSALENAGVDNWEWYGDAMQEIYGDDEESEEDIYGKKED